MHAICPNEKRNGCLNCVYYAYWSTCCTRGFTAMYTYHRHPTCTTGRVWSCFASFLYERLCPFPRLDVSLVAIAAFLHEEFAFMQQWCLFVNYFVLHNVNIECILYDILQVSGLHSYRCRTPRVLL